MKFRIKHLKQTSSTNSLARDYAMRGAKEGLVILADYQTSGRGKPGREWISPRGKNLLFSVLIRPNVRASQAPLITQAACRAVARALEDSCGIISKFKRPNDVMVNGKKICGVLVEASSGSSGKVDYVIIGIGLNMNADEGEIPEEGTSIKMLTGKIWDRKKILRSILDHLDSRSPLRSQGFATAKQGLKACGNEAAPNSSSPQGMRRGSHAGTHAHSA